MVRARSSYWMPQNNRLLNSLEIRLSYILASLVTAYNQYPDTVMPAIEFCRK